MVTGRYIPGRELYWCYHLLEKYTQRGVLQFLDSQAHCSLLDKETVSLSSYGEERFTQEVSIRISFSENNYLVQDNRVVRITHYFPTKPVLAHSPLRAISLVEKRGHLDDNKLAMIEAEFSSIFLGGRGLLSKNNFSQARHVSYSFESTIFSLGDKRQALASEVSLGETCLQEFVPVLKIKFSYHRFVDLWYILLDFSCLKIV